MPKNSVQYVASFPRERDYLDLGRTLRGGKKCAVYRRPGGFSIAFVASPSQVNKVWGGGKINITSKMIDDARRASCEGSRLGGARRVRRRR